MNKPPDSHNVTDVFPLVDGPELDALAKDIRQNGQQSAIVLYEGKILDGRRRYIACQRAKVTPKFLVLDDIKSPLSYVISANIHRRHLSPSQLALVGLNLLPFFEAEAKERQRLSKGRGQKGAKDDATFQGKSANQVAQMVGCSSGMIEKAKRIKKDAPELLSKIEGGELTVSQAHQEIVSKRSPSMNSAGSQSSARKALRIAIPQEGFEPSVNLICGDALTELRRLPNESIHACVTSVPYYLLRDYDEDGQIGLEGSVEEWVSRLVDVFREVHRVLRDDGTAWINVGDTYGYDAGSFNNRNRKKYWSKRIATARKKMRDTRTVHRKSLLFAPHRLAIALAENGWIARAEIIAGKNGTDGCKDRPVRTHEYIFLFTKTDRYFYDAESLREDYSPRTLKRGFSSTPRRPKSSDGDTTYELNSSGKLGTSIWKMNTGSSAGAGGHPAPMPMTMASKCVIAGCPEDGIVLDPFVGSGTTAIAAVENRRHCIGIDLSEEYLRIAEKRIPGAKIVKKVA